MKLDKLAIDSVEFEKMYNDVVLEEQNGREIAIIGMAVKLPSANNLDEFWENIENGKDCSGEFPDARRKDIDDFYSYKNSEETKLEYMKGAYLNDIDKFDYGFFRLTPKEACLMSPCQRLFLETVWEAIEDSGYNREMIAGTETGVYVGYSSDSDGHKYMGMIYDVEGEFDQMGIPGNMGSVIPSRISYYLDLKGPTMVIDTACSSSLVALHTACKGLRDGDCDTAIVAGIKIRLTPIDGQDELKIGIESKDGKTRAFDDDSDGTGLGEGIGVVIIKPLGKALADKDNIYAVIKSSAINQDGFSAGITAPNLSAQTDVILKAWRKANIDPETISYFEAHGTGTNVGDPIEIEGITRAFRCFTNKKQFCAVGSVKTNIGHLFAASGIVSLIKCALAIRYKKIPATINFKRPNRKISFIDSPVYVNDRIKEWNTHGQPRRCGISTFGFSGTNCHVVLEEPFDFHENKKHKENFSIFTLSGRNESLLMKNIKRYYEFLCKHSSEDLETICYTANTGRDHYEYRVLIISKDLDDLKRKLLGLISSECRSTEELGVFYGAHKVSKGIKVANDGIEITEEGKKELCEKVNEKISEYVKNGKIDMALLKEICKLYVSGADIKWDSFYAGEKYKKISLPAYEFENKRCWINVPSTWNEDSQNMSSRLYYRLFWKVKDLNHNPVSTEKKKFVVFKGLSVKTEELISVLKREGIQVIDVALGKELKKVEEGSYEISNFKNDIKDLFQMMGLNDNLSIIHMLSLKDQKEILSKEELEHSQQNGIFSLYYLTKALLELGIEKSEIYLISEYINEVTGREEFICPENAPLIGLAKVIDQEYPNIDCKCIDIDIKTEMSNLLTELNVKSKEKFITYRECVRYTEELNEVDIDDLRTRETELKDNGVYIITGGTGGIGLEIAKYFSSRKNINIIFINRSKLAERSVWNDILRKAEDKKSCSKIEAILEIEKMGSKVSYYSADISDFNEMERVYKDIKDTFGQINGVVQSAGVAGDGFIISKPEETFKEVLSPKIYGTWILDHLTNEDNLDFFIMFSSVASMFSVAGQGDYSAANSYLDSYAAFRSRLGKNTLTINWVAWKETGMAVEYGANVDTLYKAIPTDKAISAFESVLNKEVKQLLIGEMNYKNENAIEMLKQSSIELSDSIKQNIDNYSSRKIKKVKNQTLKKVKEIVLIGKESNNYTETERSLAQIWCDTLGFEEIDVNIDFYELGGDSIAATKVVNSINSYYGYSPSVNIKEVLDYPTISSFSSYFDKKYSVTNLNCEADKNMNNIKRVDERDYYPVSIPQKRIYLANQFFNNDISYNISFAIEINGYLNIKKIEEVFKNIVNRHESFRTSFYLLDGEIVQRIHDDVDFNISYVESGEEKIDELIKEFIKPFDLSQAPLLRIQIIKVDNMKHFVLFDMHHIISDFASLHIILNEFKQMYEGGVLEDLSIRYRDYAVWLNETLYSGPIAQQEKFWLSVLEGEIPKLNLPTDFKRPPIQTSEGAEIIFMFDRELKDSLNGLGKKSGATLYMVLLAALNVLLSKYSNQEDILIGMPVQGRNIKELEGIIGMFVNVLVLRNRPEREKRFVDFLADVAQNTKKALENQDYQIEMLAEKKGIKRDLSRTPFFDILFNMKNFNVDDIKVQDLEIRPYEIKLKIATHDIAILATELKDGIEFRMSYSIELFKRETMEKFATHYENIIREIICNPGIKISEINMFTEEEREEYRSALSKANIDEIDNIEFDF